MNSRVEISFFPCTLPILIANKFFQFPVFCLFTFAINLWHRKFITADVTAVSLNNPHGMKRREQDFDKTFIGNQYEDRLAILNTENIKICG